MKITIVNLVMAMSIMIATGCNTQSSGTLEKHDKDTLHQIHHVLCRLDSAQADIQYFNLLCQNQLKDTGYRINAYTIRAIDLLDALGLPVTLEDSATYDHIRMYLAYRPKTGFKLFLVPVDSASLKGSDPAKWRAGYDVLLDSAGRAIPPNSPLRNSLESEYVLDLNAPCPKTCPQNSPLDQ